MNIALKWIADHGLTVWAVVGPLAGIAWGQLLSRRSQREHWNRDNAKEEYREFLSALFEAANISISNRSLGRETTQKEDADEERADDIFIGITHTRLFINEFIERENIMGNWNKAFERYGQSHDIEELRDTLKGMIERVINEAKTLRA